MSQPALGLQVVRPTSDGSPLVIKKEDEVNVDIVFVHGLNGGSHATWTKNGFFWPRELMHQLPGARIMTYGFNTGFKRQGLFAKDHIRAFDIAGDLIDQLCHLRRGQDTRPLIMVAHSLGGLIVKQALVEARRSSQASIRTVFDAVISVIFFGTPHTIGALMGVQYRDTVKGIAKFGGYTVPHEIQRNLSLHSKELFNIRRAFNRLLVLDAKKILVVNFHETKARYGRLIVDGLTASLGESSRPIGDDHEGMVKFEDHDSPAFKMTVQDIWRALQNWTESKTIIPRAVLRTPPMLQQAQFFDEIRYDRNTLMGRSNTLRYINSYFSPLAEGHSTPLHLALVAMDLKGLILSAEDCQTLLDDLPLWPELNEKQPERPTLSQASDVNSDSSFDDRDDDANDETATTEGQELFADFQVFFIINQLQLVTASRTLSIWTPQCDNVSLPTGIRACGGFVVVRESVLPTSPPA
ncbi:Protein SERAC1 like protein [Verticillium longisporum]|nr:Protein SERAC1 like protein [Verticillium longisporum]